MVEVDTLKARLAEAIGLDAGAIGDDTRASDLEEWDSMGTMAILLMLHRDYGLKLAPNQTERLNSLAGVVELLREAGKL